MQFRSHNPIANRQISQPEANGGRKEVCEAFQNFICARGSTVFSTVSPSALENGQSPLFLNSVENFFG
jgi:hypothetical protein